MRVITEFLRHQSDVDLMILGFFVTIGATFAGWILDAALGKRGFGVLGNGCLVLMGSVIGAVVMQMQGPVSSLPEAQRIVLFSAAASSLVLIFCCAVKSRLSPV